MSNHKHRCGWIANEAQTKIARVRGRGCGFVWEHPDPPGNFFDWLFGNGPEIDEAEYKARHICPNCGIENRWKYYGRVQPGSGTYKGEKNHDRKASTESVGLGTAMGRYG